MLLKPFFFHANKTGNAHWGLEPVVQKHRRYRHAEGVTLEGLTEDAQQSVDLRGDGSVIRHVSPVGQRVLVVQGNLFRDRALVVTLGGAAHADIDPAARTTIVSAAPRQEYRVTFEAAINEVHRQCRRTTRPS